MILCHFPQFLYKLKESVPPKQNGPMVKSEDKRRRLIKQEEKRPHLIIHVWSTFELTIVEISADKAVLFQINHPLCVHETISYYNRRDKRSNETRTCLKQWKVVPGSLPETLESTMPAPLSPIKQSTPRSSPFV